jgi:hypothetical protein
VAFAGNILYHIQKDWYTYGNLLKHNHELVVGGQVEACYYPDFYAYEILPK